MIDMRHVCFSYRNEHILQKADLLVEKGEFIGIIGPNGGGKTTLLKLIMGFLSPVAGSLKVEGSIGYVPQIIKTDREFPITVKELILLGAISQAKMFKGYPKAVTDRALFLMETLGLLPHQDKVFGALSGGLAQRALVARALLSDPDILLLDEPTANIDVSSSEIIFKLLGQIVKTKTVLLVTHDLKTVIRQVSRVVCVQKGVTTFLPQNVCEHFALGLYHTPLYELDATHFDQEQTKNALCTHS